MELSYFYILEWNNSVTDIREQFPLTREDTWEIANKKEIKHPTDPKSKVPIVMTTDFLITIKDSKGTRHIARTIKPSKDLVDNVEWLHSSYFEIEDLSSITLQHYTQYLKSYISKYKTSIIEMVSEFEQKFQLENGLGLEIIKHLIARKEITVDIRRKISTHLLVEDVFILEEKEGNSCL